jgi:iron complex transport system substrate-binding protein
MASDAEVWLNTNEKTKRSQILDVDSRLENLAPYKNARIYNNNKITSEYGGSDFWESGIVHPDIILQDLRKIFTEDDDSLHYYRRLE